MVSEKLKHYDSTNCFLFIDFAVTLDYKALHLFMAKKNGDDDFVLGGRGYGVEFCVFCQAIRVS